MPPKIKTSKEAVISAAFEVARESGVASITAKSVAAMLETSVAPIFRVFKTIEELRKDTVTHVYEFYVDYLKNYPYQRSGFFTYGLGYIEFAKIYPHLFDALMEYGFFMPDAVGKVVSSQFGFIEDSVESVSHLNPEQAKQLLYHVWLYTHGIACLVCKGSLDLTEEKKKELLITAFQAFLKTYESSEMED